MKQIKMQKVLIALDYDPTAQQVAETGYSVAKAMKTEVFLLHIITNPTHYSSTKHIRILGFAGKRNTIPPKTDSVDDLKKVAQQFLDTAKDLLGDKTIQTVVTEGVVSKSILKVAEDIHADLIVMGSHNRKGSLKKEMRSVTEKVLHDTSVSLFIVPTKKQQ